MFSITQGVLQGCTLSGTLFALAVNVALRMLDAAVGPKGSMRAFADDIAIVKTAVQVTVVFQIFQHMSMVYLLQGSFTNCHFCIFHGK